MKNKGIEKLAQKIANTWNAVKIGFIQTVSVVGQWILKRILFLSLIIVVGFAIHLWPQIVAVFNWYNYVYGNGGEALITLLGLFSGATAVYYWLLPDYVAVVFHSGEQWFDWPGVWSSRKDYVLFAQSECGRLFSGRVADNQARMPRIAKPRKFKVRFFGKNRGIYRVIPIRIFPAGTEALQAKNIELGIVERPVLEFEEPDENLVLK